MMPLLLAIAAWIPAQVCAESANPASSAVPKRHLQTSPLSDRVQLMTRELGLTADQQFALQNILLEHRAEIAKVWSDPSVPAAIRVGATQAIGEKTADKIRAMLTDEQREKYNKPRQQKPVPNALGDDVQKWMDRSRRVEQPAAATVGAKGN